MATAPARLMTFAEFEQLPDPEAGRYELVHGELILVPPPVAQHFAVQRQIRRLLDQADVLRMGYADTEFSFRPSGSRDYYVCDVAWVTVSRWNEKTKESAYFSGSPELVIEILSPSNTVGEMLEKEQICLTTGAREFWIVDDTHRLVKVSPTGTRSRINPVNLSRYFSRKGRRLPSIPSLVNRRLLN